MAETLRFRPFRVNSSFFLVTVAISSVFKDRAESYNWHLHWLGDRVIPNSELCVHRFRCKMRFSCRYRFVLLLFMEQPALTTAVFASNSMGYLPRSCDFLLLRNTLRKFSAYLSSLYEFGFLVKSTYV
jgi:hypothetical protein